MLKPMLNDADWLADTVNSNGVLNDADWLAEVVLMLKPMALNDADWLADTMLMLKLMYQLMLVDWLAIRLLTRNADVY